MQAAIGVAQLDKLPEFIEKRKNNFNFIYENLKKYEEILILPKATKNSDPSWFGFPITVRKNRVFNKNQIVSYLESKKISTRMLFAGNITKQPAYENIKYKIYGDLRNTDIIMSDTFWVGVYPGLTNQMLEYILECFDEFFKKK
jgi:CDP-6-deoxy-D-xylo-4-hexulose-3-dehydrase